MDTRLWGAWIITTHLKEPPEESWLHRGALERLLGLLLRCWHQSGGKKLPELDHRLRHIDNNTTCLSLTRELRLET